MIPEHPKIMLRVVTASGKATARQFTRILKWALDPRWTLDVGFAIDIKPVDSARNTIIKDLLASDCDYLFSLDEDIIPDYNVLEALLAEDKDAISPMIFAVKQSPGDEFCVPVPLTFKRMDGKIVVNTNPDETVPESDILCGGCHLVKREVLEKVEKPLYKYTYDEDGIVSTYTDNYATRIIKEAGFKIYCHTGVMCEQIVELGTLAFNRSMVKNAEIFINNEKKKQYMARRKKLVGV